MLNFFFLQNFDFYSFPLCFLYPKTFLFPQKEAIKARSVGREVESFFVFSLIHRCIILGLLVNSILARARRHFWSHRKIAFFQRFRVVFVNVAHAVCEALQNAPLDAFVAVDSAEIQPLNVEVKGQVRA